MARYDLVIQGIPYAVDVLELGAAQATVSVNGVTYVVDLPSGGRLAAAPAAPPPPAAPQPRPAPVQAPQPVALKPAAAVAAPAGGEIVLAPMPGHVLSVAVKVGDALEAGDTVVVMEAMKMENEIKAHVAGTVVEVKVAKGQDVGVNDPLVVIGAP